MTQQELRVTGAQIGVLGDVEINHDAIDNALDIAIEQGSDILLTPEGSLSGYFPDIDQQRVEKYLDRLVNKASKAGVGLALGTCYREPGDGKVYNEIRFHDKTGNFLGFHSKILKTTGESSDYESTSLQTFDFHGITIGGLICNDLWANPGCTVEDDPHLTQKLAGKGAKVVFHAVNGGRSQNPFMEVIHDFHESNLRLRAQAGKLWIVTVDNCFPFGIPCSAPSGVIRPDGNWDVKAEYVGEQIFTHTIMI